MDRRKTTWTNGNGVYGSGGGVSASYMGNVPIPSWQQGVSTNLNRGSTSMRNVPDVSMIAYYAWVISDNGSSDWWWGTSIAAPMWAGFTALANQQAALNGLPPVGFINPAIYAIGKARFGLRSSFHDITTGGNPSSHSPTQILCCLWLRPLYRPFGAHRQAVICLSTCAVARCLPNHRHRGAGQYHIWITWQSSVGVSTNALQATAGAADGSYNTNNFTAIFAVTNSIGTSTNLRRYGRRDQFTIALLHVSGRYPNQLLILDSNRRCFYRVVIFQSDQVQRPTSPFIFPVA